MYSFIIHFHSFIHTFTPESLYKHSQQCDLKTTCVYVVYVCVFICVHVCLIIIKNTCMYAMYV